MGNTVWAILFMVWAAGAFSTAGWLVFTARPVRCRCRAVCLANEWPVLLSGVQHEVHLCSPVREVIPA